MTFEFLEGATPLDSDEMEGLKLPHIQTRVELDQVEQQNIQDGYNWVDSQRKYTGNDYLGTEFLTELHKKLFGSVWTWAGNFRHSGKNIGVDYSQISTELRNLLDDAKYWVKFNTYSREEFAARFHHRLVKIHPFPNGNGRHSRIMTDIILEKLLSFPAINWSSESLGNEGEYQQQYIHALRQADKNDYTLLIKFVSR